MTFGFFVETNVSQGAVIFDQNHVIDGTIRGVYDSYAKSREQKKERYQTRQQYQLSEYTIPNAYPQYWGLLRTKNLTYR